MNKQRGVATLVVVMVLLFLMALVAAYTSRNLIFEQRTSVNQYRSTQAFEAAEARCRMGAGHAQWRGALDRVAPKPRRLAPAHRSGSATSGSTPPLAWCSPWRRRALPGCVWTNGAWACECPDGTASTLTPPTTGGIAPAFRVRFTVNGLARPGVRAH
jgi:hypothetical protein